MAEILLQAVAFLVALAAFLCLVGMAAISIGCWFFEQTGWAVHKKIDDIDHYLQLCGPGDGGYSFTSVSSNAVQIGSKIEASKLAKMTDGGIIPWVEVRDELAGGVR